MRPSPLTVLYGGAAAIAAGFAVLAFTWGRVAGVAAVPLQLPYVVSGGTAGLGLVLVGAVALNIGVKWAEATRDDERLAALERLLEAAAAGAAPTVPARRRRAADR